MRLLLACSLLLCSACGDGNHGSDAATPADLSVLRDTASVPDHDYTPDLTVLPDLAVPVDLTAPDDLARLPPDLTEVPDDAGGMMMIPRCAPNAGYGGVPMPPKLPPCGTSGNCNGHDYNLDCDGISCTCKFDKKVIVLFVQMQNTCNDMMNVWSNVCMF
jgi:hypothetical protein